MSYILILTPSLRSWGKLPKIPSDFHPTNIPEKKGLLACMNFLASVLVYNLTSLDLLQTHLSLGSPLPSSQCHRARPRSKSVAFLSPTRPSSRSTSPPPSQHLSTRKIYTGPSFPPAFIYFSLFAALLNLASSFVRLNQIHVLDISALSISTLSTHLFIDLGQSYTPSPIALVGKPSLSLQDSRLILSLYDWMSLFVSLVSLVCSVYNFASVRNLMLRERERTSTMWILGKSLSGTFRKRSFWSWRSLTSYWTRYSDKQDVLDGEELDNVRFDDRGSIGNQMANHSFTASIRSRSHSQTLPPNTFPLSPLRLSKKGHLRTGSSSGCIVSPGFVGERMVGEKSEVV